MSNLLYYQMFIDGTNRPKSLSRLDVVLDRSKKCLSILNSKNVEALINFGTFFRKSHCVNYMEKS